MAVAGSQKVAFSAILASLVFISGFATMALEFAASRLLVPIFGGSINTWGVLIGIILAALTVGYHAGGRIADSRRRPASLPRLCSMIFSSGLYIVFVPILWQAIEPYADPTSTMSLAVFTLILILPPTVLLGIVSPYAVKLAASTLATLGKKTGNLYSIATVGSIVGTFATVFLLVPLLEIDNILFLLGLTLVIPAAILGLRPLPKFMAACLTALLVLSSVAVSGGNSFSIPLGFGQSDLNFLDGSIVSGMIVHEAQTPYSQLQVVDSHRSGLAENDSIDIDSPYYRVRSLYLNGDLHSRMYVDRPNELAVTYTQYFPLGFVFNPDAQNVLFVGGGGFSGPKQFIADYSDVSVDVVEIDPVVIDVAMEYFDVPSDNPRLKIYNDDGRRFFLPENRQYDIIVLDAYSKSYVPFHLMTREYYQLLAERLADDGVIVSNHIGSVGELPYNYEASKLWRAAYKTMAEVFPSVHVFPTRPDTDFAQNIILVAGKNGSAMTGAEIQERQSALGYTQVDYADHLHDPARIRTDDVTVFTDQFAPVDTFLSPLDNQPYSIDEGQDTRSPGSATGSLPSSVGLATLLIAGIWAVYFRGIWKAGAK
jgi:spermidine synthase